MASLERREAGLQTPVLPRIQEQSGMSKHHEEYEELYAWEYRGTVIGLLTDVGARYGHYFLMLLGLTLTERCTQSTFVSCDNTDSVGLRSYAFVCACEYSKAFIVTFPSIAVSTFLLIIGRDMLQQRLYYGMLKVGGVIEYHFTTPQKDPFMIMLVVNYLHCIGYIVLTSVKLNILTSLEDTGDLGKRSEDSLQIQIMAEVTTVSILFPMTLVSICIYGAYNMHLALIPLNEFVQSEQDAERKLKSCQVLQDSVLKRLVESDEGDIHLSAAVTKAAGRIRRCAAMMSEYDYGVNRCSVAEANGVHVSGASLSSSFWAWPVLMGGFRDNADWSDRGFWSLWLCFVAFSILLLVEEFVFLCWSMWTAVEEASEGRFPNLLAVCVMAIHLLFVCAAARSVIRYALPRAGEPSRTVTSEPSSSDNSAIAV
eukprot:TRINITY_DN76884_c0_g1_i1.p1 TRINITY_DN76884_c0_g1~~TRINITY_DN76884_c0_g1_i1.p1  ORF type:complete len:454 (+),score=64.38 TRINITY_DN76884_c0_g1_i1:86-1363(+)